MNQVSDELLLIGFMLHLFCPYTCILIGVYNYFYVLDEKTCKMRITSNVNFDLLLYHIENSGDRHMSYLLIYVAIIAHLLQICLLN